jgi:hypothetical protein
MAHFCLVLGPKKTGQLSKEKEIGLNRMGWIQGPRKKRAAFLLHSGGGIQQLTNLLWPNKLS